MTPHCATKRLHCVDCLLCSEIHFGTQIGLSLSIYPSSSVFLLLLCPRCLIRYGQVQEMNDRLIAHLSNLTIEPLFIVVASITLRDTAVIYVSASRGEQPSTNRLSCSKSVTR